MHAWRCAGKDVILLLRKAITQLTLLRWRKHYLFSREYFLDNSLQKYSSRESQENSLSRAQEKNLFLFVRISRNYIQENVDSTLCSEQTEIVSFNLTFFIEMLNLPEYKDILNI